MRHETLLLYGMEGERRKGSTPRLSPENSRAIYVCGSRLPSESVRTPEEVTLAPTTVVAAIGHLLKYWNNTLPPFVFLVFYSLDDVPKDLAASKKALKELLDEIQVRA